MKHEKTNISSDLILGGKLEAHGRMKMVARMGRQRSQGRESTKLAVQTIVCVPCLLMLFVVLK